MNTTLSSYTLTIHHERIVATTEAMVADRVAEMERIYPAAEADLDDAEAMLRHACAIIDERTGRDVYDAVMAAIRCRTCDERVDQHAPGCVTARSERRWAD